MVGVDGGTSASELTRSGPEERRQRDHVSCVSATSAPPLSPLLALRKPAFVS